MREEISLQSKAYFGGFICKNLNCKKKEYHRMVRFATCLDN